MSLKTVIENLDGLDEAITKLYTEKDGKFILQLDGVDAHPDVANLKSAYESVKLDRENVRKERDEYKAKTSTLPADFDQEKWDKLKDGKADEAALIKLRETLEAERDTALTELKAVKEQARNNALERDLTDALNASGVTNPMFSQAARKMLADKVQINDDGKPFVETDMGPASLKDHVSRWAAGEGKDFVTPPKGGGASGNDSGRTIAKEEFAKMGDEERINLFRSDPEKFKQLSAA